MAEILKQKFNGSVLKDVLVGNLKVGNQFCLVFSFKININYYHLYKYAYLFRYICFQKINYLGTKKWQR